MSVLSNSAIAAMATATLTLAFPVTAADKTPLTLKPSTPWQVDYAKDSCRLARKFGTDKNAHLLVLDQYEPGPFFQITVAGAFLRGFSGKKFAMAFGPAGSSQTVDRALNLSYEPFGPAVMINSMRLVERPGADVPKESVREEDLAASYWTIPEPEKEKSVTYLQVQRQGQAPLLLGLGPMHEPMKALRACTDELVTHWGIDAAAHKSLTRRVRPAENPGNWALSRDYPSSLMVQGIQGLIQFRLIVDEVGRVDSCHIQASTRPVEFDKTVCAVLSRRARFNPALDANGKPIKSYWRSSFRFQIQ